jgi:hypothetical protein
VSKLLVMAAMASVSDSNVEEVFSLPHPWIWNHYVRLLGKLKMSRWTTSTVG